MKYVYSDRGQPNQLLLNSGDDDGGALFSDANTVSLPGGTEYTRSIALGDVNGDGLIDVVVGNWFLPNLLLLNSGDDDGGALFSDASTISLPGGSEQTYSIALGDVNGDGLIDVVIGNPGQDNYYQPNLPLLNSGDDDGGSLFSDVNTVLLPGDSDATRSIALGDVNGDGLIDVVIGNYSKENQVLYSLPCTNGGARLHSKSWCFKCPSVMQQGLNSPFCRECIPDFTSDTGELCDVPCSLGERPFGQDMCMQCANGTYYDNLVQRSDNNPESWDRDRCVDCPTGIYARSGMEQCLDCRPGFRQPDKAASLCIECNAEDYEPAFGQAQCISCASGGYCGSDSSINGGYTRCPAEELTIV
jgi:hypothetical protein